MRLLGDIVVVEHIGKNVESKIIHIPDDARNKLGGIKARVIDIGFVSPQRRKRKKYYPQDDLRVGDIVIVPEQFGTRDRYPRNEKAIIYDGEDVLAVIPNFLRPA